MSLTITSSAFQHGGAIPAQYTCDGANISPPLRWSGAPAGTATFALVADDPDAPRGTWAHWVLYDLPAMTTALDEHVPPQASLPNGAKQGTNDFRAIGYGGPCPPSGVHRYFFRLYALDARLGLPSGATKEQLLEVMAGHILAHAELMGTYRR